MSETPFCDWLTVTTPIDQGPALLESLRPLLDFCGAKEELVHPRKRIFRVCDGVLSVEEKHSAIMIVSASGALCAYLRGNSLWGEYLSVLGTFPHRVTTLHATREDAVDAPPIVEAICKIADQGELRLTRKVIPPWQCKRLLSPGVVDGRLTGSLYGGLPTAEVRVVVYDKRDERVTRGFEDPGPKVRYEIRIKSGVGPTLRDAYEPSAIFYKFASPALLPAPHWVQPWVSQAEGFEMPERVNFTPAELMERKLHASADVARLLELARQCGPNGFELLVNRLRRLSIQDQAALLAADAA